MKAEKKEKQRVIAYVDGSNLYFGMIDSGLRHCKWLDISKLIQGFIHANQTLVAIKFFTSRITHNPPKEKRQTTYLEALESSGVDLIFGSYQAKFMECRECGHDWILPTEKMTDVNIATQLLMDAHLDFYDTAILISGDSDFVPCIESVNTVFIDKSVVVFFPPGRHNNSVAEVARANQVIGRQKLIECQLPLEIENKDGYILHKPEGW